MVLFMVYCLFLQEALVILLLWDVAYISLIEELCEISSFEKSLYL